MKLCRSIRTLPNIKNFNRPLCTKTLEFAENELEAGPNTDPTETQSSENHIQLKPKKQPGKKHLEEINTFFNENPAIAQYRQYLPEKIVNGRSYNDPEYIYLVCPKIASSIAKHIVTRLECNDQIIAEANPGLGLISKSLLDKGILSIRLYEANKELREYLEEAFLGHQGVSLFKRDIFNLGKYYYLDRLDKGKRVSDLLKGVPKKSWTDDPFMTIVGTMSKFNFLSYLVISIALQRQTALYGRIDLFLITYKKFWNYFTATNEQPKAYRFWAIQMQLFFDAELIDKYPRKYFLPWQTLKKTDPEDELYLIRVSMKKNFPLPADHFVPFYCFLKILFGKGGTNIIPTCEKWVPGCGKNLILPTLNHKDYFEDMNIFTRFQELNPSQIVAVYKELAAHRDFQDSPFMDMVEAEWLKGETIDTNLNDDIIQKYQISNKES